jgi:hypothetical protein
MAVRTEQETARLPAIAGGELLAGEHGIRAYGHDSTRGKHRDGENITAGSPRKISRTEMKRRWRAARRADDSVLQATTTAREQTRAKGSWVLRNLDAELGTVLRAATRRCGCCEGIGKRATECSASFIYTVDAPRKERREIEKDSALSTMESFGYLSITRKKMAQSPIHGTH